MSELAWFRSLTESDSQLVSMVRHALHDDVLEGKHPPVGVAILTDLQPVTLRQVALLAQSSRVMVLLAPEARLRAEDKFLLLAAGAADVLDWPGPDALSSRIVPRLARWAEIETLMADDRLRKIAAGESKIWLALLRQVVEIAAFSTGSLLLTGETGTGKEQVARLVHFLDRRARKADLVTVDCTTLSQELMGSELFGHERGAFTGAIAPRDGAMALAHRGTLFLDEIGELPIALQAQLLRALQERTYKRIGSNVWQRAEFRLICATNRNLAEEMRAGRFRADLYYRIADNTLHLPPLRERRDDILPLVKHFWRIATNSDEVPKFDPAVERFLEDRDYPGNVRDLRRIVMALHSRHPGDGMISVGAVPETERPPSPVATPDDPEESELLPMDPWQHPGFVGTIASALARGIGLRDIGRAAAEVAVQLVLEQEQFNLQRAARRLGVTDRALQKRREGRKTAS